MGVIRKKTGTRGTDGGLKYICDVCSADITATVSLFLHCSSCRLGLQMLQATTRSAPKPRSECAHMLNNIDRFEYTAPKSLAMITTFAYHALVKEPPPETTTPPPIHTLSLNNILYRYSIQIGAQMKNLLC